MSDQKGNIQACWTVELNCECPHCEEYVNLLDDPDFWYINENLEIAENMTDKSNNLAVHCPKCDQDFVVECIY